MCGDKAVLNARGIVAVVPVKPLNLAKSRLAPVLDSAQREALAANLLRTVVGAAIDVPAVAVWVVGGGPPLAEMAGELGVDWCDDGGAGLNEALTVAFAAAYESGMSPLYLPADLPFVSPEDIEGAIVASRSGSVLALAPARRDGGTNAILSPLRSPFPPRLGFDSFRRHRDQARRMGLEVAVCETPGLGYDLDTPQDLEAYQAMDPDLLRQLIAP